MSKAKVNRSRRADGRELAPSRLRRQSPDTRESVLPIKEN